MSAQNNLAETLRGLHIPGNPIILTNVYDAASARAVAGLPATRALATASAAVAAAAGVKDGEMSFETNLAAVRGIASVAREFGLPLTVDFQDGYGEQLEDALGKLMELGVVGVNLEDCNKDTHQLYTVAEGTERVGRVVAAAKAHGVPSFVVNARADSLLHAGPISDVIERGKAYLAAGATTVFVLGGARGGVSRSEVAQLSLAFEGRLNVALRLSEGYLTVKEIAEIGVARISIGPQLQGLSMKFLAEQAEKLLLR